MGNPEFEYKRSPQVCPHCGAVPEVYVHRSEDIVDVLPREGGTDWAVEYPHEEGFEYYYKQCASHAGKEMRVVAKG